MDDNNKNLILATGLSLAVLLVWMYFFPPAEPPVTEDPNATTATQTATPTAAAPLSTTSTGETTQAYYHLEHLRERYL